MASKVIAAARLLSTKSHVIPGQLLVSELFFEVPKDYGSSSSGSIQLFARSVVKNERPIVPLSESDAKQAGQKPWFVYLEGGPGFGCREPQEMSVTRAALSRGYQVLFLDYRGTGLSTPVTASTLALQGDAQKQADYLKLFRQDNIVRDFEAVRECLTKDYPAEKKTWSIFGQSFGGFVSLTYLSFFPQGLRETFMTGGLAPVGKPPLAVYEATFKKVVERNEAYYEKYPEDKKTVHQIAQFIQSKGGKIPLPSGGFLTLPRLLTLGCIFGTHGGLDALHGVLLKLKVDLDQFGFFTRTPLVTLEQFFSFDCNIIYAILHEAIYCYKPGVASNWAALRAGKDIQQFTWLSKELDLSGAASEEPLFFSGEMIFPLHFQTYPELIELEEVSEILATYDGWPDLYNEDQLGKNTVPVYAASYIDDMYVDFELAKQTAATVKGIKVYETNSMYHSALRHRTDDVLRELFKLRDDPID